MGKIGKRPGKGGNYVQESGPHLLSSNTEAKRLLAQTLALLPPLVAAFWFFPWTSLRVFAVSAGTVLLLQIPLFDKNKKSLIHDVSRILIAAVIFGMLLPPQIPLEVILTGVLIVLLYGQVLFKDTASQIFHPAVVGVVFLAVCFPMKMEALLNEKAPFLQSWMYVAGPSTDKPLLLSLLTGQYYGAIGTTSAIALFLSFIILAVFRVIDFLLPIVYIAAVAVFSYFFGMSVTESVLTGSFLFTAVFLVTDPRGLPLARRARVVSVLVAALLAVVFRYLTREAYAAVTGVLWMNVLSPWMDRWSKPRESK